MIFADDADKAFLLTKGIGLDTRSVGMVMTVGPITAALMGVPAGFAADRIGARLVMVVGVAVFTLGAFTMSHVSVANGVPIYITAMLLMSVGMSVFQTPNNTAVMAAALPAQRGLVSGLLALARNLGLITGASLMGAIFALAVGGDSSTAAPSAIVEGMRAAFQVAGFMGAVALLLALAILRRPRHAA